MRAGLLFCGVVAAAALAAAGCGTASAVAPPRALTAGTHGILPGVSCPRPLRCLAVGEYSATGPRYALAERWDGSGWSIETSPAPPARARASLVGLSCAAASDCIAVGSSERVVRQPTTRPPAVRTLIEHWNGSGWSIETSPNRPGASSRLSAVACTSASACIAVGASDADAAGVRSRTLAERWDGSRWTILRSRDPAGAPYSFLSSISCTSQSSCVAVGEYFPGGSQQDRNHVLIERWNGVGWTLAASPRLPGSIASYLSAVSCPARSDCVAVGTVDYPHRKSDSYGGPRERTLIEHWNGSAWAVVASPNAPGPPSDRLSGVSCASAADCIAVGAAARRTPPGSTDGARTLAVHWNGSAWSIMKSPSPSVNSSLIQVSCAGSAACMAVGGYGKLGRQPPRTLTERWNGSAWSVLPS